MNTKVKIGHTIHGFGPNKIIALHDWMGNYKNWEGAVPFINKEKFTYAFMEVRGYGKSKGLEGEFSTDEIAKDIFNLADDLGWDQFHLIGHSMTGMAVQKALLKDNLNRVKSIVAITPVSAAGSPVDDETRSFFEQIMTNKEVAVMGYGAFTNNKLSDTWKTQRAINLHKNSDTTAMEGYLNMWTTENFLDKVKGNDKSILVIHGMEDHPGFSEEAVKKGFGHYPNATFKSIANSGHYPMQQTPVYTISLIEEFLNAHL